MFLNSVKNSHLEASVVLAGLSIAAAHLIFGIDKSSMSIEAVRGLNFCLVLLVIVFLIVSAAWLTSWAADHSYDIMALSLIALAKFTIYFGANAMFSAKLWEMGIFLFVAGASLFYLRILLSAKAHSKVAA